MGRSCRRSQVVSGQVEAKVNDAAPSIPLPFNMPTHNTIDIVAAADMGPRTQRPGIIFQTRP